MKKRKGIIELVVIIVILLVALILLLAFKNKIAQPINNAFSTTSTQIEALTTEVTTSKTSGTVQSGGAN